MNRLKILAKREVEERGGKIPKKLRIKIGRGLFIFASLPLFSAWAYLFAIPMMMTVSPTMWAKDKIRYFNEWRILR